MRFVARALTGSGSELTAPVSGSMTLCTPRKSEYLERADLRNDPMALFRNHVDLRPVNNLRVRVALLLPLSCNLAWSWVLIVLRRTMDMSQLEKIGRRDVFRGTSVPSLMCKMAVLVV